MTHSPWEPANHLVADGLYSTLPIMKGTVLCPHWECTHFRYGYAFPELRASNSTTICGLMDRLHHHHFDRENSLFGK